MSKLNTGQGAVCKLIHRPFRFLSIAFMMVDRKVIWKGRQSSPRSHGFSLYVPFICDSQKISNAFKAVNASRATMLGQNTVSCKKSVS